MNGTEFNVSEFNKMHHRLFTGKTEQHYGKCGSPQRYSARYGSTLWPLSSPLIQIRKLDDNW